MNIVYIYTGINSAYIYIYRYNIERDEKEREREFTADVSIEIYGQCALMG